MKPRDIWFVVAFVAIVNPVFACDLNGLTEAIDRLKGGKEPDAGSTAMACAQILQNKDEVKNASTLILLLGSNFSNDERLKDAIKNCPIEMYKRAC